MGGLSRNQQTTCGPGIYLLFYEGRLIYIGKFLGVRNAPFSGDVTSQRWWAHIGTITMRGHRVSFPKGSLARIMHYSGPFCMSGDRTKAGTSGLRAKRACVQPLMHSDRAVSLLSPLRVFLPIKDQLTVRLEGSKACLEGSQHRHRCLGGVTFLKRARNVIA